MPGLGQWIRPTEHGCIEEIEHARAYTAWEAERAAAASAARWREKLDLAGLAGRLAACTFTSFLPRKAWPALAGLKAKVQEYADALLAGELPGGKNWLVLVGPVGTGKTHLAAAVIREALQAGRPAYFREWTTYLQRIQATWDRRDDQGGERESDILAELQRGWLVAIDDIDKRRSTEWVKGRLFSFLNQRYNDQLPTIITLNIPLTAPDPRAPGRLALHDVMGGAVLDRTIESMHAYLEFNGPSFRSGQTWGN